MQQICPKCNADAYLYSVRDGHDQVEHFQCKRCKYIFPLYGECSLCLKFYSDSGNADRIAKALMSKRIRQDFRTLGGVRSKERAAARRASLDKPVLENNNSSGKREPLKGNEK